MLTTDQIDLFDRLKVAEHLDDPPRSDGQTEEQARNSQVESFRQACMLAADAVPSAADVLAHWKD